MDKTDRASLPQNDEKTDAPSSATNLVIYKGIGRLSFAIILSVTVALTIVSGRWLENRNVSLGFPVRAWIFLAFIAVVGVLPRARNMGMHPAKVLLTFVPIANLILGLRCLVYQEGYEATRKVDKTGKIVAAIIAMIFVIGYMLVFRAALHGTF